MIMMRESIRQIWVNAVTLSCHDWEVKPQNKQTNKQKGTRRQRSGKGTIRKRFPPQKTDMETGVEISSWPLARHGLNLLGAT